VETESEKFRCTTEKTQPKGMSMFLDWAKLAGRSHCSNKPLAIFRPSNRTLIQFCSKTSRGLRFSSASRRHQHVQPRCLFEFYDDLLERQFIALLCATTTIPNSSSLRSGVADLGLIMCTRCDNFEVANKVGVSHRCHT
jgi:hypothetical protein